MPPADPPPLRRPPERLLAWQRAVHALVTRPLDSAGRTSRALLHGVPVARLADSLVKPSATLDPLERVGIYNRMYWARVLDSLAEDFPGLRALVGPRRFAELSRRYLIAHPSRRPSLRGLGAHLPRFVRRHPQLAGPHAAAAADLARYEWAQIEAFDSASPAALTPADVAHRPAHRLRLRLPPGLAILQLDHAVDEFWHAVKRGGSFRADTSNSRVARRAAAPRPADDLPPPARRRVHLVVHRFAGQIHTKRLPPAAARILRALARGTPLARAAALCPAAHAASLPTWFAEWMSLGWLARRD